MTTKQSGPADVARALYAALIDAARPDGTPFVRLADGSPAWMTDVVHAAHGDMAPDDVRYGMIRDAACALIEVRPRRWDDKAAEIADGMVSDLDGDLIRWLASRVGRVDYCDEAASDGLVDPTAGLIAVISAGQRQEACEVVTLLIAAIRERVEEQAEQADEEEDSDEAAA